MPPVGDSGFSTSRQHRAGKKSISKGMDLLCSPPLEVTRVIKCPLKDLHFPKYLLFPQPDKGCVGQQL